jgi:hypothetical protein
VYDCIIYIVYYILVFGVSDVRPSEILTGQSVVPVSSAFKVDTPCIHVTVHHKIFLFKLPNRSTNYPDFFYYKTLHVSGILSAHHQEFSTVNSALVSFMQVFDDRFQAESGWNSETCRVL